MKEKIVKMQQEPEVRKPPLEKQRGRDENVDSVLSTHLKYAGAFLKRDVSKKSSKPKRKK